MKSGRTSFVILRLVISVGYPLAGAQRYSTSQTLRFNGYELVDRKVPATTTDWVCVRG
jgi:hypothetical protein